MTSWLTKPGGSRPGTVLPRGPIDSAVVAGQSEASAIASWRRRAGRLILVSSRLPASVQVDSDGVHVTSSAGGVATGLRAIHRPGEDLWIGWPGLALRADAPESPAVRQRLAGLGCEAVFLSEDEASGFYEGLANGTLWPLLHSFLDRIPVVIEGWDAYESANRKFAEAAAAAYEPGDVIWVHDYQLALVPGMLRRMLPEARIGFFLHVPVPPADVFRVFPWRVEFLQGVLGADLVGFHTEAYRRNFLASARELLPPGGVTDLRSFEARGGKLGVFPMGVDAAAWERSARDPDARAVARLLREEAKGRKILAGVDRLDYTKGIHHRLKAIEVLFSEGLVDPSEVLAVQLYVPSRQTIAAYEEKRSEVEELAGRINGLFGGLGAAPLRTMFGTVSPIELAGLYSAADVMLVTPLRDGMNLVAKEFVATRGDGDGVLLLSELAGAAVELTEAVRVNPYDTRAMAEAIGRAVGMEVTERRRRMTDLRRRVQSRDVYDWYAAFVGELNRSEPLTGTPPPFPRARSLS